ncbi:MAG TPA: ATP-binding protein [Lysobacter sp.]
MTAPPMPPAKAARRPLLLAWSGGKDAAWTLHALRGRADVEVVALLATVDAGDGRASMQGVRRELLQAQAVAAGLPLIEAVIAPRSDNARYEAAFADALARAKARWPALDTVAFGDLRLPDVRAWRKASCAAMGWRIETPLFGLDTRGLAHAMIAGGLRARLCCVDLERLDAGFAGRAFDDRLLADLPPGCDPCGENGEFHTLVLDGPMFDRALAVREGGPMLRDGRLLYADFLPA